MPPGPFAVSSLIIHPKIGLYILFGGGEGRGALLTIDDDNDGEELFPEDQKRSCSPTTTHWWNKGLESGGERGERIKCFLGILSAILCPPLLLFFPFFFVVHGWGAHHDRRFGGKKRLDGWMDGWMGGWRGLPTLEDPLFQYICMARDNITYLSKRTYSSSSVFQDYGGNITGSSHTLLPSTV